MLKVLILSWFKLGELRNNSDERDIIHVIDITVNDISICIDIDAYIICGQLQVFAFVGQRLTILPMSDSFSVPRGCFLVQVGITSRPENFFNHGCLLYIIWYGCFRGTPKWMVYNGKPYWNGWFGGTPIFGNTNICIWIYGDTEREWDMDVLRILLQCFCNLDWKRW